MSRHLFVTDVYLPVRLTGGDSAREGRVEVFFRGQWGGICNEDWDVNDVDVVCRQLGFHSGTNLLVAGNYYRDDHVPAFLQDLKCQGDESDLAVCLQRSLLGFGYNYCHSVNLVGVSCQSGKLPTIIRHRNSKLCLELQTKFLILSLNLKTILDNR